MEALLVVSDLNIAKRLAYNYVLHFLFNPTVCSQWFGSAYDRDLIFRVSIISYCCKDGVEQNIMRRTNPSEDQGNHNKENQTPGHTWHININEPARKCNSQKGLWYSIRFWVHLHLWTNVQMSSLLYNLVIQGCTARKNEGRVCLSLCSKILNMY